MRMSREATNQDTYDVEVRDLVHWYGRTKVIDNINLKVRQGEFFSILGPSGSGKTTTLRIIGGFVFPTSGSVYIQNELMDTRPPY
jgi:ABC-type Fe3+/spermidine/putrescine transport system ATPase subunit